MQTVIIGRHMEVTDAIRNHIEKKLVRLQKYYNKISEIRVVIESEGLGHKIEIIVNADNRQPFVVAQAGEDMYACFDSALDKIERQLVRHKEKSRNRKGRTSTAETSVDFIEGQDDGGT